MKQKEELLRKLKRDWQGLKESEGIEAGGSRKRAKRLKVVEKEVFKSRRRAKNCKDNARGEEIGQGTRGINRLRNAEEKAVDDVEEVLEQLLECEAVGCSKKQG